MILWKYSIGTTLPALTLGHKVSTNPHSLGFVSMLPLQFPWRASPRGPPLTPSSTRSTCCPASARTRRSARRTSATPSGSTTSPATTGERLLLPQRTQGNSSHTHSQRHTGSSAWLLRSSPQLLTRQVKPDRPMQINWELLSWEQHVAHSCVLCAVHKCPVVIGAWERTACRVIYLFFSSNTLKSVFLYVCV